MQRLVGQVTMLYVNLETWKPYHTSPLPLSLPQRSWWWVR